LIWTTCLAERRDFANALLRGAWSVVLEDTRIVTAGPARSTWTTPSWEKLADEAPRVPALRCGQRCRGTARCAEEARPGPAPVHLESTQSGARRGRHESSLQSARPGRTGRVLRAVSMLTVKEAAAVVRLTQWAIYRAIKRGELTAYKPGGRLRIHEVDLDAWLESTRVRMETPSAARPARLIPAATLSRAAPRRAATDSLRARVRASRGKRTAA